jgi:hypothetical protein
VTQVFAFDPSPVTGFYSVEKDIRDYNKENLKIDRIYERGEILAILRSFTNFVYKPSAINPSIRQKAVGRVSPTQNLPYLINFVTFICFVSDH